MNNTDRRIEAVSIHNATALLEALHSRVAVGGGNRERQLDDWRSLRAICNQMVARIELLSKETTKAKVE
jgi:hypothetical protein